MKTRVKLAIATYVIAILIRLGFGLRYLTARALTSYHIAAIGTAWSDLPRSYQILFLAMIRGGGSGMLAVAVAGAFLLAYPFRKGENWSRWALLLTGLTIDISMTYVALTVHLGTPASTPWAVPAFGILLDVLGFTLSWPERSSSDDLRTVTR
jgi:hypothetical protein